MADGKKAEGENGKNNMKSNLSMNANIFMRNFFYTYYFLKLRVSIVRGMPPPPSKMRGKSKAPFYSSAIFSISHCFFGLFFFSLFFPSPFFSAIFFRYP